MKQTNASAKKEAPKPAMPKPQPAEGLMQGQDKRWTEQEVSRLRALYPGEKTIPRLAKSLGRTEGSVRGKLEQLRKQGEKLVKQDHRPWSPSDISELKRLFEAHKTNEEMVRALDRTEVSINGMLQRLKEDGRIARKETKDWSESEVSALKRLFKEDKTSSEIAGLLHRTERSVLSKLYTLQVLDRNLRKIKKWTGQEDDTLKRLYLANDALSGIATALNRTKGSVETRLCKLRKDDVSLRRGIGSAEDVRQQIEELLTKLEPQEKGQNSGSL